MKGMPDRCTGACGREPGCLNCAVVQFPLWFRVLVVLVFAALVVGFAVVAVQ